MRTIFYIGNFKAPQFNAAGKRVYGNSKIFQELGYKVVCIGNGNYEETVYDNMKFYSLKKGANFIKIYKEIKNIIKKEAESDNNTIVLYGALSISLLSVLLLRFSKKNNYKIFSDCPDWLNNKTNNILFYLIKKIDYEFEKRVINKKTDGIILISSYLRDYYKKLKTVVIPPLNLYNNGDIEIQNKDVKQFIYAGIPFRLNEKNIDSSQMKDRLDLIIDIFLNVYNMNDKFELKIYGISKEQYIYAVPRHENGLNTCKNIKFYGLVENREVVENVKKADFTILLRDKTRETMAGFSTKIAESLSSFTPVITNNTSDINKYVTNGENGFIFDTSNKEECVNEIIKILNMNSDEIAKMKNNCKSNQQFYYKNYINEMKELIKDV